jgi:hypothetical protein
MTNMAGSDVLVAVWWFSACAGAVALVGAAVSPAVRRHALLAAAVLLFVAGVLGLPSIGIVFIAASAVCALASRRRAARA